MLVQSSVTQEVSLCPACPFVTVRAKPHPLSLLAGLCVCVAFRYPAVRYVTQRPWDRIPLNTKTLIMNPLVGCLAGGRNKVSEGSGGLSDHRSEWIGQVAGGGARLLSNRPFRSCVRPSVTKTTTLTPLALPVFRVPLVMTRVWLRRPTNDSTRTSPPRDCRS